MNHDDRDHWTTWQRNHRLPGEHRSAVFDDDPEEQDGRIPTAYAVAGGLVVLAIVVFSIINAWQRPEPTQNIERKDRP